MRRCIQEWTMQSLWKTAFKKLEVIWPPFKGCLPQILFGLISNAFYHLFHRHIKYIKGMRIWVLTNENIQSNQNLHDY